MPAEDTASIVRATEAEALHNLATVLRLCQNGKLQCSVKTQRPSATTVALVAEALVDGDFYPDDAIAAFAWPLLLQAGGLARLEGSRLTLTPKGRKALDATAHDVIRELWGRWIAKAPIDEFSRIEQIKGQRSAAALSAAGARRRVVANALPLCAHGEWITVDDLFQAMRRRGLNPTVARSDRAVWKLYLVDPEYGSLGYLDHHEWPILEGRYTLAVLFEYAATLGLLDVDYIRPEGARDDFRHQWGGDDLEALSRYDGLKAIRLTALGSYVAGLTMTYVPAPSPVPDTALQVLADHTVVAVIDLPAVDRLVLDAFAVRTAERVWAFSSNSLMSAADAGRMPGEFAAFLQARAATGLPATVLRLLDDAESRMGQVRDLGLCRVLECADAQLATLLARDRVLRGLCTRLGERHLLIRQQDEPKARSALVKLGYPIGSATAELHLRRIRGMK